ncbi:MAG: LON peptidase substrate-binding domain-containing protein [Thermoanaerobaculum sp.]
MQAGFVLPLYPLDGFVLLPTLEVEVTPVGAVAQEVIRRASAHDDLLVASFYEDEAVHEVGVQAQVIPTDKSQGSVIFRALSRCRLRQLEAEDIPMVRAEHFPDTPRPMQRQEPLRRLLLRRFSRLWRDADRKLSDGMRTLSLETLTWHLTAKLQLEPSQQQGLLNLADPVARGQVLLLALRELEQRQRFLRPFMWLRKGGQWN